MSRFNYSPRRRDRNDPHFGLQLIAGPVADPIVASDVKTQVRQDIPDDDSYITNSIIPAARDFMEGWLGRRLLTQTWNLTLDEFPAGAREIYIPYGPVQSIVSVQYVDTAGNTQTISAANYELDIATFEARLYPAYSLIWPIARWKRNCVTVQYITGATSAANVPPKLIHALKLLCAYFYEHRGDSPEDMPPSIARLINMEREEWL